MNSFIVPWYADYFAAFFGCLSGGLVAVRRDFDVVGIFFLAFLAGFGGGLLRDGVFLGKSAVLLGNPNYLIVAIVATGISILFRQRLSKMGRIISICDAVGLSFYTIFGITITYALKFPPASCVLVGVVNAIGGGLLRDICAGDKPMCFRPGEFYALVSLVGGILFFAVLYFSGTVAAAAVAAIVLMLVVRLLTIVFNWHTKSFSAFNKPTRRP